MKLRSKTSLNQSEGEFLKKNPRRLGRRRGQASTHLCLAQRSRSQDSPSPSLRAVKRGWVPSDAPPLGCSFSQREELRFELREDSRFLCGICDYGNWGRHPVVLRGPHHSAAQFVKRCRSSLQLVCKRPQNLGNEVRPAINPAGVDLHQMGA